MQRYRQSAFTLIEVLVVLVIVAIVTTVAALAFTGRANARDVQIAANNFEPITTLAASEATLLPAIIGIRIESHSYQFYIYHPGGKVAMGYWQALTQSRLAGKHAFRRGIVVHVLEKGHQQKPVKQPQLVFYPSGINNAAVLEFTNRNQKPIYHVTLTATGEVHVERVS